MVQNSEAPVSRVKCFPDTLFSSFPSSPRFCSHPRHPVLWFLVHREVFCIYKQENLCFPPLPLFFFFFEVWEHTIPWGCKESDMTEQLNWTEHIIETVLHIDFFPHLMHLGGYVIVCVCSVAQLCPTPWDSMGCSPPGSSVRGTFQARLLEWVAISYSRKSSQPRDWTHISCISCTAGVVFTTDPPEKQLCRISI